VSGFDINFARKIIKRIAARLGQKHKLTREETHWTDEKR